MIREINGFQLCTVFKNMESESLDVCRQCYLSKIRAVSERVGIDLFEAVREFNAGDRKIIE